jgi:PAS domain S-box-containing protein
MFRMKTQTKLIIVMCLVLCVFIIGLKFLYYSEGKRALLQIEESSKDREKLLKELIEVLGDPARSFSYDYSLWDDMLSFAKTGDTEWAHENIDASLYTFNSSMAIIYNLNGDKIYGVTRPEFSSVLSDSILNQVFVTSCKTKLFAHYFIPTSHGVMEIHIAPIQPSDDDKRLCPPRGHFVVGQMFDSNYVAVLERILQANIYITNDSIKSIQNQNIDNGPSDGVFKYSYCLHGANDKHIAEIVCKSESPTYLAIRQADNGRLIYLILFCSAILLILLVSLYIWVSKPLKYVMDCLTSNEPGHLNYLRRSGLEFTKIGELISTFFNQNTELEEEIAERRKSEDALIQEKLFTDAVIDSIPGPFYVLDTNGLNVRWNKAQEELTGLPSEEMAGVSALNVIYEDDREKVAQKIREAFASGFAEVESRVITPDKAVHNYYFSGRTMKTENDIYIVGTGTDMTERIKAENALMDRESLLKATLESTADGILVVDRDGKVTHQNKRFQELWHIPADLIAKRDDDKLIAFVLDQLKDPLAFVEKVKALYGSTDESFDVLEFVDGRVFERYSCPLIREENIIGRVWSFRDVSSRIKDEKDRHELQEKLERAGRFESLGLLAGGVAHDLNNMLGPIVGYSELLMKDIGSDSKAGTRVKKIIRSAEDAAVVIQDLLTLARRGRYEMHQLSINQVVNSYLESPSFEKLKEQFPLIATQVNLQPDIAMIHGSEAHLGKAVMNLVTNAFEAMPAGGTLTIMTEKIHLDYLISGFQNIDSGDYIILRVKDTGAGIAKEDIEKIFEPYFSKKKMGNSGSGLGLSVVYGIIKDHKGYYDVLSEIGKGTEFVLYFPISHETIIPDKIETEQIRGGSELILIVDDSADQRELAAEIVASLGYGIKTAENGHQALEILADNQFDLVMLDMIMEPNFDGLDTYNQIQNISPDLKAIVVSGFSATQRVQKMLELGASAYVKKPYNIESLAQALRNALDGKTAVVAK